MRFTHVICTSHDCVRVYCTGLNEAYVIPPESLRYPRTYMTHAHTLHVSGCFLTQCCNLFILLLINPITYYFTERCYAMSFIKDDAVQYVRNITIKHKT